MARVMTQERGPTPIPAGKRSRRGSIANGDDLPDDIRRMLKLTVTPSGALPLLPLPDEVSEEWYDSRKTRGSRGLVIHTLEAGAGPGRPLILLIHGFPGLAFSWRKVLPTLASAENYVVAVDLRGFGRTVGWEDAPYASTDLRQFALIEHVRDIVVLVAGLGYETVECVVGHGIGAEIASLCCILYREMFQSCVMVSNPYRPPQSLDSELVAHTSSGQTPIATRASAAVWDRPRKHVFSSRADDDEVHLTLASLTPPRKHHRAYHASPEAADHWYRPPQGRHEFLRGYFHLKSAAYAANRPMPLAGWNAFELTKLPSYYTMPLNLSMPETVQEAMESESAGKTKSWLSDEELSVYVDEYERTGFQGALNLFRAVADETLREDPLTCGRQICVPTTYISGNCDWASVQDPGALQQLPQVCRDFRGVRIIRSAGHWPHEEQPGQLAAMILSFLWQIKRPRQNNTDAVSQSPPLSRQSSAPQHGTARLASPPPAMKSVSPLRTSKDSQRQEDRSIASQLLPKVAYVPTDGSRGRRSSSISKMSKMTAEERQALLEEDQKMIAQFIRDNRSRGAQKADSTTSTAATSGSRPSSRSRNRHDARRPSASRKRTESQSKRRSPSRNHSIDMLRNGRSQTPANDAIAGHSEQSQQQSSSSGRLRQGTPIPDSPIPDLASPSTLDNPNPFAEPRSRTDPSSSSHDTSKSTSSQTTTTATSVSPPKRSQSFTSGSSPPSNNRHTILVDPTRSPPMSQRSPKHPAPSPDSASVAKENDRIYSLVQRRAWENMQEAQKYFHRKGMPVSRKEQDERSASAGLVEGSGKERRGSDKREQEEAEKRLEKDRRQLKDFDMRTHPGTAPAHRDTFEIPASMR